MGEIEKYPDQRTGLVSSSVEEEKCIDRASGFESPNTVGWEEEFQV